MTHNKKGTFYERINSINNGYDYGLDAYDFADIVDEAKKELLTFKEFVDAGMMKEQKEDNSDIYSVYIGRMIEKWFGK
jgi:hypothetical protein